MLSEPSLPLVYLLIAVPPSYSVNSAPDSGAFWSSTFTTSTAWKTSSLSVWGLFQMVSDLSPSMAMV